MKRKSIFRRAKLDTKTLEKQKAKLERRLDNLKRNLVTIMQTIERLATVPKGDN